MDYIALFQELGTVYASIVTIASIITATTDTPREGGLWRFLYGIIEYMALVNDRAKQR
jgi:hypothetical protein